MDVYAIVMRHGSTENNGNGKYRGHLPLPLTPQGIMEATEGARFIQRLPMGVKPQWIVSSDLPSARQTASVCARILGLKTMRPMKQLRGMDIGTFAGKKKEEVEAALKECFRHPDEKCGGGERPRDFDARCEAAFASIEETARKTGKIALVVTHGSDTVFLAKRDGSAERDANYQEPPVEPGGLLKVTITQAIPVFKIANDAKPLPLYPQDHIAGMRVPKGGSNCVKCEYLAKNMLDCTNKYFIAWNGSDVIPGAIDEYCSDWFEPKEGTLSPA